MRDKGCTVLAHGTKHDVLHPSTLARLPATFIFLVAVAIISLVPAAPAAASKAPNPSIRDIRLMRFGPRHPATKANRDRNEALALLVAGAAHQRHERYAKALQCFERSWRLDPQSATILQGIVPLAIRLGREAEAVRWALNVTDPSGADPKTLHYLGLQLAARGDWPNALTLYRWSLAADGDAKNSAAGVLRRMEMGRIYFMAGKPKEAAECFADVVRALDQPEQFGIDEAFKQKFLLMDKPGPTYQFFGECFLAADRPSDAKAAFEKANPDKAMRPFNLARLRAKTGQSAEALESLDAALNEGLSDQGPIVYELLAELLDRLDKKAELIDRLEKLRAAEPDNIPLGYFLAARYREADRPAKAEALYRDLLQKKPLAAGYRGLIDLNRQGKQYDALLEVLGEAVEKIGVLQTLQAESQTVSGDAAATAALVEIARDRIKNAPADFGRGPRVAVGLMALEAKQFDAAGEFFNAALAVTRESEASAELKKASSAGALPSLPGLPTQAGEVYMVWGLGLLGGERADEAAKVFQRAIDEKASTSDDPAYYFYLSGALALADRHDEALAAAKVAAEKRKELARFRSRPAWVLYFAKRYDEAMKAYRALVEQFDADTSDETRDVLREARLVLSNLCVMQGDQQQAEEWLERVLDEFPDDSGALNDLGYLWADQGKNLLRARRMIQSAVNAEPDIAAYRDSLGWVLFRLEKYPEALAELQKAVAGKEPDGTVLEHLGDTYLKMKDRPKAVESWRRAAEAFRQEKEPEKAKAVEKKILQIER